MSSKTVLMAVGESRHDYLKRVQRWCRNEYNKRRETEYCHCSHTAAAVMHAAEKRFTDIGTFGVEGWCDDCGSNGWQYLNTGDTYELTIVFSSKSERFILSSWGDIVEREDNR